MPGHRTVLFASFDTSQFKDPEAHYINYENDTNFPIINNVPATLNFELSSRDVSSVEPTINFTSNGIDGLGNILTTFNIPKINFIDQKIFFTARFKDGVIPFKREPLIQSANEFITTYNSGDTIRLFNTDNESLLLRETDLTLSLLSGDTIISAESAKFETNFNALSADIGGYFKGHVTSAISGTDFRIKISYDSKSTSFNKSITAISTPFDIYPDTGVYDVRKRNEDNDQTQNYKDLIYQEVLLDKPSFFNGLLGQSVGSKNSSPETLGIKTFEKSANFVANTSDPDYCNIKALLSMFNSMEIDFEDYNQQFPPSLTRLVDILSVSPSKQMPKQNQYQSNFNDKGFTSKTVFGKNKGDYLPFETTILYTGEDSKYILAYEKFSENYTLINTNILSAVNVDYTGINSYALSSYNDTWGWGLVVPKGTTGIDVLDYYEFYDYNNTIDGTIMEDFIDYTNLKCTYLQAVTSYNQIMDKDGIADNLLQYNLYTNCGLIGEEVVIPATSIANNTSIYNTSNSNNTSTYNTNNNTNNTGNSNQSSPGYY